LSGSESKEPLAPFLVAILTICVLQGVTWAASELWPAVGQYLFYLFIGLHLLWVLFVLMAIAVCDRRARWLMVTLPLGAPFLGTLLLSVLIVPLGFVAGIMFPGFPGS
jgi:heme/copper-type cytochrome/quinol oxidase subunit 3